MSKSKKIRLIRKIHSLNLKPRLRKILIAWLSESPFDKKPRKYRAKEKPLSMDEYFQCVSEYSRLPSQKIQEEREKIHPVNVPFVLKKAA